MNFRKVRARGPLWGAHALRENSKKEKGKIKGGGRARAKIVDFGKVPQKHKIEKKSTEL